MEVKANELLGDDGYLVLFWYNPDGNESDEAKLINNNAEQYLKARKSVPAFSAILDGLDNEIIKKMDNEI